MDDSVTWMSVPIVVPVEVDLADPIYIPAVFLTTTAIRPDVAFWFQNDIAVVSESRWKGWQVQIYDRQRPKDPLFKQPQNRPDTVQLAACPSPMIVLLTDQVSEMEAEIARWYFDVLHAFRIGVCGPREALLRIMRSFRWGSPIMQVISRLQFRRREWQLLPHDIEVMLAFSFSHQTIIRWMDKYAVPR